MRKRDLPLRITDHGKVNGGGAGKKVRVGSPSLVAVDFFGGVKVAWSALVESIACIQVPEKVQNSALYIR